MPDLDDDMMRSDPEIMALSPVPNDSRASTHLQNIVQLTTANFYQAAWLLFSGIDHIPAKMILMILFWRHIGPDGAGFLSVVILGSLLNGFKLF